MEFHDIIEVFNIYFLVMPHSSTSVQVSDTTMFNSSTKAGSIKRKTLLFQRFHVSAEE